ncbi:MAG TPA: class I SAM-dependent methyltransferase [Candidatus Paceibacterota bacterium]|nr:class I SAM-dependent methyltransferase [Candidatus Paceibacterota bacterium]
MERKDLTTSNWHDYELLDSGDGMKLERYGEVIVARPETQAIWKPLQPELWEKADAVFEWKEGTSEWKKKNDIPASWPLSWNEVKFTARLTSFKHTGIFPEQVANWEWLENHVRALENPKILNLFGYTGIASIVAAKAGAPVTHIDASKQSLDWAHDNARLSGITEGQIKYLFEDASAFVKREARRGNTYEGIILDPPAFGRGAKGEVWKIEEQLQDLIATTKELLSDKPGSFYLLNGYAAGYNAQSFAQLIESIFANVNGNFGDLLIKESSSERVIPAGIYTRFSL